MTAPLIHELVAERLTAEIVHGDLKPGERLNEVELAQRLGVSRSPMREALRQLEHDGLVVSKSRRGTWVAEIDAKLATDFYNCRILVEGHCAMESAPHLVESDIDHARTILDQMERDHEADPIYPRLSLIDQFHETYRVRCPNLQLAEMCRQLERRALRFRVIRIVRGGTNDDSIKHHHQILQAMERGDPEQMRDSVTTLLSSSRDIIRHWLDDDEPVPSGGESTTG